MPKYEYKISICMIVKNEEQNLERCLKSIYELVKSGLAEIIIVDTGSIDNTIEIAKKYTDKIFLHNWQNDFAEARNYSISKAKGEFIFVLDADEELEVDGLEEIVGFFSKDDYKDYGVLYFKEKNFIDFSLNQYGIFTRAFIFKNTNNFRYTGAIHEQPNCDGRRLNLDIYILHYGYIQDSDLQEKKFIRNITLLKKEIKTEPYNLYLRYQSAISYFAHKDLKEAKDEIDIVINIIIKQKFDKLHLLYYDAGIRIYIGNGLFKEALNLCNIGLYNQPDFIDLLFYKATALFAMKKDKETIDTVENYINLIKEFKEHDIYNDSRFLFYHLNTKDVALNMLLVSCYLTNEYNKFIYYVKQIDDINILTDKLYIIIKVYLKINNFSELTEFYNKNVHKSKNEKFKLIFNYFIYKELNENNKDLIKIFRSQLNYEYTKYDYEKLQYEFIEIYNFDNADVTTAKYIIDDFIELISNFNYKNNFNKVYLIMKAIKFVIIRTLNSNQINDIQSETIFKIIEKYLELGLNFKNNDKILDEEEIRFFKLFEDAISKFKSGNLLNGVQKIKQAVEEYNYAARMMQVYLDKYVPIYNNYITIKGQIKCLIENNDLIKAENLLQEYEKNIPEDLENYSIKAVIKIMQNDLKKAKEILNKGIEKHKNNFDLLYNLAYVYEMDNEVTKSIKYYQEAFENTDSLDNKNLIINKLEQINKI